MPFPFSSPSFLSFNPRDIRRNIRKNNYYIYIIIIILHNFNYYTILQITVHIPTLSKNERIIYHHQNYFQNSC